MSFFGTLENLTLLILREASSNNPCHHVQCELFTCVHVKIPELFHTKVASATSVHVTTDEDVHVNTERCLFPSIILIYYINYHFEGQHKQRELELCMKAALASQTHTEGNLSQESQFGY